MHSFLTTLHTILSAYPAGIKLASIGILAVGWIVGRTRAEYLETLKRHHAGGAMLPTLCIRVATLLGMAIIIDGMWFHSYASVILAAGLLLTTLFAAAICRSVARGVAHRSLLANGYDRPTSPILPKQRGS